ncbi:MAG: transcriptional regulator [Defluviicoccus sp.]|nr:MAG: transcriptional regulator [Defluviicoccus sp.]
MPLTRQFKDTVRERVQRDPAFREELLREGVQCLLSGDVDTGKIILRDYINATIGFDSLSQAVGTPPKSLMRMFSRRGNPNARNLMTIIGHLQKASGVELTVETRH